MERKKSTLKLASIAPKQYTQAHSGNIVIIKDMETGQRFPATIRIKAVTCGKPNCKKCPHYSYAYAQFRDGINVREKYLGVVK